MNERDAKFALMSLEVIEKLVQKTMTNLDKWAVLDEIKRLKKLVESEIDIPREV